MARILVLANSRKLNGRCVAGVDLDTGQWVRPVGPRPTGELNHDEYQVSINGADVDAVFGHEIDAPLGASRATEYHPEDMEIDGRWRPLRKWSTAHIASEFAHMISTTEAPFDNFTDYLTAEEIRSRHTQCSLQLMDVAEVSAYHTRSFSGRHQVRARFEIGGHSHDLSISDVHIERDFGLRGDLGRSLLVVSLTEPFQDKFYKVIATLVPFPDIGNRSAGLR